MMAIPKAPISVTVDLPLGLRDEINHSLSSAIARPYRRLMVSGKPIGHVTYLLYADGRRQGFGPSWYPNGAEDFRNDPQRAQQLEQLEWKVLGALAVSDRDHLLFFPGYQGDFVERQRGNAVTLRGQIEAPLDHFTFSRSGREFHATARDRHERVTKHFHGFKPAKGENFSGLCSIAFRNQDVLELAFRSNQFNWDVPVSDQCRRESLRDRAREETRDHLIMPHSNADPQGSIVSLTLYAQSGEPDPRFAKFMKGGFAPWLADNMVWPETSPISQFPVQIGDELDLTIWVCCELHVGDLKHKMSFNELPHDAAR